MDFSLVTDAYTTSLNAAKLDINIILHQYDLASS
jgi:hypothetical protein